MPLIVNYKFTNGLIIMYKQSPVLRMRVSEQRTPIIKNIDLASCSPLLYWSWYIPYATRHICSMHCGVLFEGVVHESYCLRVVVFCSVATELPPEVRVHCTLHIVESLVR